MTSSVIKYAIALLFVISQLSAQVLQYKAVWYKPVKSSLMGELADDTGPAPTPRHQAVLSLDQNFYGIAVNMHANSIVIRLVDDDAYPSQYGSGMSYDPKGRPKPQFAVAQELIVSVAAKYGLKVIFAINTSDYHINVDDNFGNSSMGNGRSWDFIHSLFDPGAFYGVIATTQLSAVGLTDHNVSAYYGDPRIAGWILGGEWELEYPAQHQYLHDWWPFFYSLVHYGGASTAFAATYPQSLLDGVPDDPGCDPARLSVGGAGSPIGHIQSFKALFSQLSPQPDIWGLQWYGNNNYRLSCVKADLGVLTSAMETAVYPTSASQLMFMEGGSNQTDNPDLSQFYTDSVNFAASSGSAGIAAWASDGNINTGNCTTGDDVGNQSRWDLVKVLSPVIDGCATPDRLPAVCTGQSGGCDAAFGVPAAGWHENNATLVPYLWSSSFGLIEYYDMTDAGYAFATALNAH